MQTFYQLVGQKCKNSEKKLKILEKFPYQIGQIEEGLDAREICSPSSSVPFPSIEQQQQSSEDSFANTPATIVPLESMRRPVESYAEIPNPGILENPEGTLTEHGLTTATLDAPSTTVCRSCRQSDDNDGDTEPVHFRKVLQVSSFLGEGWPPSSPAMDVRFHETRPRSLSSWCGQKSKHGEVCIQ